MVYFRHNKVDYYHPWSKGVVGETFGLKEYGKHISIKDYLDSPVDVIDDILDGVIKGTKDLEDAKAKARKEANGGKDPVNLDLNALLKEENNR